MSWSRTGYRAAVAFTLFGGIWMLREQPVLWLLFWGGCIGLFWFAPRNPALALGGYLGMLYGTPRYSPLLEAVVTAHLLDCLAALAAWGLLLGGGADAIRARWRSPLLIAATAMFTWVGLCAVVASVRGIAPIDTPGHSALFFVHDAVLMLVAAAALTSAARWRAMVLVLSAGIAVRLWWQGVDGIRFEGDIGPLLLMAVPLALSLGRLEQTAVLKAFFFGAVAAALVSVGLTYNRASAVAFAALLLVLLWQFRRKPWLVAGSLVVLLMAAAWFATTPFASRFASVRAEVEGRVIGSARERLDLWSVGFTMVSEHPFVGVGPGRYASELSDYVPGLHRKVAHNSYVQMAAETGWPGLIVYVSLFGLVLLTSARVSRQQVDAEVAALALAIQASTVVYLVASLFISRHDMALAYVLVGGLAALASAPAEANPASVAIT